MVIQAPVGWVITFSVTFSEAVSFSDTGVGLNFRIGNTLVTATSDAGNTIAGTLKTFSYTVKAGDTDANGISIATNPLAITGASTTITDAAGNNAVLTYTSTTGDSASHTIDTTAPTVGINASLLALNAESGNTASTVTFSFSEDPGTSFTLIDVVVKDASGNTLSAGTHFDWGTLGGTGLSRNATFTPRAGFSGSMVLSIASGSFQDTAPPPSPESNNVLPAF
jgi:hypothetical protein